MQARSGSSESEVMLGIVDDIEEKSQKDQVVTPSKPSKPLLTSDVQIVVHPGILAARNYYRWQKLFAKNHALLS